MRRKPTTVAAVNVTGNDQPELSGSSSMEDQDGTTVVAAVVARTTIATEIATDLGEDVDVVIITILGNRGTMVGKKEVPTVPVVVGTVTFRGSTIGLAERSNYLSNSNNNTNRMEDGRETLEEDGSGTVVKVRARGHRRIRSGTNLR